LLNDIAVLTLSSEVDLNDTIQLACLPNPKIENFPSDTDQPIAVWAMGWGEQENDGKFSSQVLKNVQLTLYDPYDCNLVLPEYEKNWNTQLCAGEINGQKDTCQGCILFIYFSYQ
jgi:hypothetical protein